MTRNLYATDRIKGFTDGVVAIVMTILVLELVLPHQNTHHLSANDLKTFLWDQVDNFVAYLLSFWMVSKYWMSHCELFEKVTWVNSRIINLNLVFILSLTFIPFPTQIMSHYDNALSYILFNLSIGWPALMLAIMLKAVHSHEGVKEHLKSHFATHQKDFTYLVLMVLLSVIIAIVSLWTQWSMLLWLLTRFFEKIEPYCQQWLPRL